ncbi:MAG: glycosyltransferase [Alphaproteobacteria bacterium]|jgi:glycosyltransferase involved in cell wall biosynthesis|nr:glycosyltransferase [Alphaproteobacteria bacterium]
MNPSANKIKVSLVVPFYNMELYLDDCIKSLINQDMSDMEIILVDDASPDGSLAIAQKYAAKDNRIKIIRHEVNKHIGGARNTGLANANGEYILFIDSDDYLIDDSNIISNLYKQANGNNTDLVIFDYKRDIEGKLSYISSPKLISDKYSFNSSSSIANFLLNHYTFNAVWACFYKRDFLQKHNFTFTENNPIDDKVNPLWMLKTESVIYLPKAYYVWRYREGSVTNIKVKKNLYKDHVVMVLSIASFIDVNVWQSVYIGTRLLFEVFFYTFPLLREFDMGDESHRQQMVKEMADVLNKVSYVFNSQYFDEAVAFEKIRLPKNYSKEDLIKFINALKNSQDQENLKNILYYSYVKLYARKKKKARIKNIFNKVFLKGK